MKTKSYQFLIKSYLVSGFSLAELIMSSIIALVVMTMLGYGLYNLLRNDLSNNADAELVNNIRQFKSELHRCLIYSYRIPHSGYDSQDIFEADC
jgi:hypothetical protein